MALLAFIRTFFSMFVGSGLSGQLIKAYEAKLSATNDQQRLEAEKDVTRIEAHVWMAKIAASDRWGATSMGRYLIVIPFGIWWAAIFADSIFSFSWDVLALPPNIMQMSVYLIPAIVLADASSTAIKSLKR